MQEQFFIEYNNGFINVYNDMFGHTYVDFLDNKEECLEPKKETLLKWLNRLKRKDFYNRTLLPWMFWQETKGKLDPSIKRMIIKEMEKCVK